MQGRGKVTPGKDFSPEQRDTHTAALPSPAVPREKPKHHREAAPQPASPEPALECPCRDLLSYEIERYQGNDVSENSSLLKMLRDSVGFSTTSIPTDKRAAL